MASKQDLITAVKNRKALEQEYPDVGEKERQRKKIEKDIQEFLKSGGQIEKVDHAANAWSNKQAINRYDVQKIKDRANWALQREAEIKKKKDQ
jgi:hypothetical protein